MTDLSLTADQLDRYSRHIMLDGVGAEGQQHIMETDVLCIGAGGLGSPVIQYLAAAGVGTLGVADDDTVERSNLQRQVIHGDDDVGHPKVESARGFIEKQNPDVSVQTHATRVTQDNIDRLLEEYDLVVDGSDNFETRYLVNDACTLAGVPFVHGAILRFEGQVATFDATEPGPCYRCLFPQAPEPGTIPDCASVGVLGVLPGTIGCIQATEAIKLMLEYGDTLHGRMLFYDAAEMSIQEIQIDQRPNCPVCTNGGINSVHDVEYEATCAI